MKVTSLACDVLLCTHFSQAMNQQDIAAQTTCQQCTVTAAQTDCCTTEHILAVWNCQCRQG